MPPTTRKRSYTNTEDAVKNKPRRSARATVNFVPSHITLQAGDGLYRGESPKSWMDASGSSVAFFSSAYDVAQKYATRGRTVNMYTLKRPVRLINVCNKDMLSELGKMTHIQNVAYLNTDGFCRRTSQLSSDIKLAQEICKIGQHNGKTIHGFATVGAKNFHDEVALCNPSMFLQYPPISMGPSLDKKRRGM